MTQKALGLACLASLAAPSAFALDRDLAIAERDEVTLGGELMNKHWSEGAVRVDDVSAHPYANLRFWDVGLKLDGVLAVASDDQNPFGGSVDSFETTEVTARLDYLFEIENLLQILPFAQVTAYPNITGKTPFNWLGTDFWFMLPWEGIELGASVQYNLTDQTDPDNENAPGHHHWVFEFGGREFWQDAPLDLMLWQVVQTASRSYHRDTIGDNFQGLTTVNLGAKATLPLPYEELWAFLKVESYWYFDGDDREALEAQGRDTNEVLIGIGIEYRME